MKKLNLNFDKFSQYKKIHGFEHLATVFTLVGFARLLYNMGKYEEAEPKYSQALAIQEKILGLYHRHTVFTLASLARLLYDMRNYEEAEP